MVYYAFKQLDPLFSRRASPNRENFFLDAKAAMGLFIITYLTNNNGQNIIRKNLYCVYFCQDGFHETNEP